MIIAPTSAGALSALGVLVANVVKDQSRTVMLPCQQSEIAKLASTFREMEHDARAVLLSEGFQMSRQLHARSLGVRYRGQSFELEIKKTSGDIAGSFHAAHRDRYGYSQEGSEIEIVSARLRSSGVVKELPNTKIASGRLRNTAKPSEQVTAYIAGQKTRVDVYRRDELRGGGRLRTPCIVTEYSATTLIPEGTRASVDGFGNLLIETFAGDLTAE
jgi:N-methylhydantoinase A